MPFSLRRTALAGAPTVRRLKTYSAQSGYVYHYFYEGYRAFRERSEAGLEFVFHISADRKQWSDLSVYLPTDATAPWETSHSRQLSATERYAVAKLALFQAFDERTPAQMKPPVHVRAADAQALLDTLDL